MLHQIILVGTALNHPTIDVGLTSIVVKHDPLARYREKIRICSREIVDQWTSVS